jgi:hypothetical protein
LSIDTQFFERLQSVSVVDGATHTQEDDVESNGGIWGMLQRSFCCLLQRSAGLRWCPRNT